MHVNGKELAVEIDGPQDAPVVLLVHGLGGTSNFYQVQTDALAAAAARGPGGLRRRGPLPGHRGHQHHRRTPTTWPPSWTR